jgi:hypothetical protein
MGIAVASCVAKYKFGPQETGLGKQEMVFIRIVQDGSGCKLADKTPSEIRTEVKGKTGPGQITWVIAGSCENSRVAISREFKKGGQRHPVVTGLTAEGVEAKEGNKITATVRPDLPAGLQKALYRFEILINGKPAEFNSPADDGSFFLCPVWPCGDFKENY